MSTKVTIDHAFPPDIDFHAFYELFDEDNIYLELVDTPLVETRLSKYHGNKLVTTIAIPGKLWNRIVRRGELRSYSGEDFDNPLSEEERTRLINEGLEQSIEMLQGMIKDREKHNDTSRPEE